MHYVLESHYVLKSVKHFCGNCGRLLVFWLSSTYLANIIIVKILVEITYLEWTAAKIGIHISHDTANRDLPDTVNDESLMG